MNYPYANGTIKAIESNILDKNKLSKLVVIDKVDFIKTLNEIGYGNNEIKNIEEIFAYQLDTFKELLNSITPDKVHTDLFFFEDDCLNIKTLYKHKIFGVDIPTSLKSSVIAFEDLKKMIIDEDFNEADKRFSKFIKKLNAELVGVTSSRMVSSKIDGLFYQFVLKTNKNQTLKKYFKLRIDIANLSTLIRSTNLKWDIEEFNQMFISGGLISKEIFISAYKENNKEYYFRSFYNEKLSAILKNYEENKNINVFERQLDNYLLLFMSEYRNDSFDIGPIIYYYLKKEAEAKNIRHIYAFGNVSMSDLLDY